MKKFIIMLLILMYAHPSYSRSCLNHNRQKISMWEYVSKFDAIFVGKPYEPILHKYENEELLIGSKVKISKSYKGLPSNTEKTELHYGQTLSPIAFNTDEKIFTANYHEPSSTYVWAGIDGCVYNRNFSDSDLINYLESPDYKKDQEREKKQIPWTLIISLLIISMLAFISKKTFLKRKKIKLF